MGITVADENVDDQPPNEFRELLVPVGKNIKDESADGVVVGCLVFLVGINVEYLCEVFDMDTAFGCSVITFDCIGPGFPLRYRDATKASQINISELHEFDFRRLYAGSGCQSHHRIFVRRNIRVVRVRGFNNPFFVAVVQCELAAAFDHREFEL